MICRYSYVVTLSMSVPWTVQILGRIEVNFLPFENIHATISQLIAWIDDYWSTRKSLQSRAGLIMISLIKQEEHKYGTQKKSHEAFPKSSSKWSPDTPLLHKAIAQHSLHKTDWWRPVGLIRSDPISQVITRTEEGAGYTHMPYSTHTEDKTQDTLSAHVRSICKNLL